VQELSLAKECVIKKLDLLTNSTIVDDDEEVKVHILEKLQSSKYKLKLFSLYKSLKKKNLRIMKRKQQK
jgi:FixJ family two-component response regulator